MAAGSSACRVAGSRSHGVAGLRAVDIAARSLDGRPDEHGVDRLDTEPGEVLADEPVEGVQVTEPHGGMQVGRSRGGQRPVRAGRSLSAVLPVVGAVRNLGATSWQIADTGAGRLDAFWEYGVDDGNLLGGALIAREAGAVVTDTAGNPWTVGAEGFLASAPTLHGRLIATLADID
jgi:inositol monophosphatase family protein